jgi:hypothetical protein
LSNDIRYAQLARNALKPFIVSTRHNGVMVQTEHGPFYEEYTAEVATLVLNGMIFSLCGVYDFVRVFPDNKLARKIFEDGINTLKGLLPEYDLGYWSLYNLCKASWYPKDDPSTITYQHLHITQLDFLYRLTKDQLFKDYSRKFKKQLNLINIPRMYFNKFKALKKLKRI